MLEKVASVLQKVELSKRAQAFPSELSGGEKSRGSLARALVFEPQVLLLDEPFAALDLSLRKDLRSLVRTWTAEKQIGLLLVTHDEDEAAQVSNRVLEISEARQDSLRASRFFVSRSGSR